MPADAYVILPVGVSVLVVSADAIAEGGVSHHGDGRAAGFAEFDLSVDEVPAQPVPISSGVAFGLAIGLMATAVRRLRG